MECPLKTHERYVKRAWQAKEQAAISRFCAESEQLEHYAKDKLTRKNLDLIVANNITEAGAGFDLDTNVVSIYTKDGQEKQYPQQSKKEVAAHILDELEAYAQRRDKQ